MISKGKNNTGRFPLILWIFLLGGTVQSTVGQEVCDFYINSCPRQFDGDTIHVPANVIAMGPRVHGCEGDTTTADTSSPPAIMFLIDNSGSMSGTAGSDPTGARFNVTQALLDTIYKNRPNAQVGLAVFQQYLYFDTATSGTFWYSTYFKTMSKVYDTLPSQAYMPLLTLNRLYNGKRGIDILDSALATTGSGSNVALKYTPNFNMQVTGGQGTTNINIAFLAAREAFANTTTKKSSQFIVFLSDGEANRGAQDPGPDGINYFRDSTRNVPTTFTVFFNSGGSTTAPASIQTMTKNIQANGYSATNPKSNLWTINTSFDALLALITTNILGTILEGSASSMIVSAVTLSDTSTIYSNGYFVFSERFPLLRDITPFKLPLTYSYTDQTSGKIRDTVINVNF
jgi:hypothetical protein